MNVDCDALKLWNVVVVESMTSVEVEASSSESVFALIFSSLFAN